MCTKWVGRKILRIVNFMWNVNHYECKMCKRNVDWCGDKNI